jgi:sporulation protein YlmC with PRC-barrel domain
MTDVPLNADVKCTDGSGGKSTYVIINPTTQQVTHFVVKEKRSCHTERLVPVDRIKETTHDLIRLRCTKGELAKMEPFIEIEFAQRNISYVDPVVSLSQMRSCVVSKTTAVPVRHARIPPGELAVHRGAHVEATDGHVGRVDEFLVDQATGHITHLVLLGGHLWSQKDVTVPISQIDHIEEDTIYLKLDKHAVESLPAVPVRRQ